MSLPERDSTNHQATERMTDVLARIHAELDEIAQRIDCNQATIAKSTWNLVPADADYIRAMQDADLSAQRIAGIADFLRTLGNSLQPDLHIDTAPATGTLKLTEQIRSIGTAGWNVHAKDEDDAGNVDLF